MIALVKVDNPGGGKPEPPTLFLLFRLINLLGLGAIALREFWLHRPWVVRASQPLSAALSEALYDAARSVITMLAWTLGVIVCYMLVELVIHIAARLKEAQNRRYGTKA